MKYAVIILINKNTFYCCVELKSTDITLICVRIRQFSATQGRELVAPPLSGEPAVASSASSAVRREDRVAGPAGRAELTVACESCPFVSSSSRLVVVCVFALCVCVSRTSSSQIQQLSR